MPHKETETARVPSAVSSGRRTQRHMGTWPSDSQRFANRSAAGAALGATIADHLARTRHNTPAAAAATAAAAGTTSTASDAGTAGTASINDRPLVLGLPRGGIVIAREIAKTLDADLDIIVTRKVGVPWSPGCAVGAIADEGPAVFDHGALASARARTSAMIPTVRIERQEVRRRRTLYRGNRPIPTIANRTVVIADDGLTPSLVARAAIRAIRAQSPASIVYAAPVCAAESADWLSSEADAIIHLHSPRVFHALGLWYRDATPITDTDAAKILATMWGGPSTPEG